MYKIKHLASYLAANDFLAPSLSSSFFIIYLLKSKSLDNSNTCFITNQRGNVQTTTHHHHVANIHHGPRRPLRHPIRPPSPLQVRLASLQPQATREQPPHAQRTGIQCTIGGGVGAEEGEGGEGGTDWFGSFEGEWIRRGFVLV